MLNKNYNVTIYLALIETDSFNFVVTSGGVEFYSHPSPHSTSRVLKGLCRNMKVSIILNQLNIIFNAIVQNCIAILINRKHVRFFLLTYFTSIHFLKLWEIFCVQKWRC